MQRVLEDLMEIEFVSDDGRKFHVSFSGGVAQLGPDGSTIEKLIRVADERLYTAKRRGRKRIVSAAAVLSAR